MNPELNTFSLSIISSSITNLECILQVSTTKQEEYVKKKMRKEMFYETEGYAVTHFYCENHHYDLSNESKRIQENVHQLTYHLRKLYYYPVDEEETSHEKDKDKDKDKENERNRDQSESSIFFAVGSFKSIIPFPILGKDLTLFEKSQDGDITPCSSIKCWSPNQLICNYLGDDKEFHIILFIQKGSSDKILTYLPSDLQLFLPSFLTPDQGFSILDDDFSTNEDFLPDQDCMVNRTTEVMSSALQEKNLLPTFSTAVHHTSLLFCPFETISIIPLASSLTSLNDCAVKSFYCRIRSKFPMNIYEMFSKIVSTKMKQLEYSTTNEMNQN
uniref:Uncharacterized protein n=1 Tax=Jakoba libera TaxID=143017 RepID=M4QL70_JAKLI|nr:hypothetical protein L048_p058 [Jakoba libera]AGH24198.1 hypothetical protein [Jakoba libera]